MNKIRVIVSILTSIILTTTSLFLIVYIALLGTFMNEGYSIWCINNSNYVEQSIVDIQDNLLNISQSTGIKEKIIKESINIVDLHNEIVKYNTAISRHLRNNTDKFIYNVETKVFEERMYNNIIEDLTKDNYVISNNSDTGIKRLVKESGKIYANMITLNSDLIKVFSKSFVIFIKFKYHAVGVFTGTLLLLVLINRKRHIYLKYLGASFTLTGVITILVYLFSIYLGISTKLNLDPVYLKNLMEAILSGFLRDTLILGICATGLGILLSIGNKMVLGCKEL